MVFPQHPGRVEAVGIIVELQAVLVHVGVVESAAEVGDALEAEPDLTRLARLGNHRRLIRQRAEMGQRQIPVIEEVHRHHFLLLIGKQALHHRVVIGGKSVDSDGVGIFSPIGGVPGTDQSFDPLQLFCTGEVTGLWSLGHPGTGNQCETQSDAKKNEDAMERCCVFHNRIERFIKDESNTNVPNSSKIRPIRITALFYHRIDDRWKGVIGLGWLYRRVRHTSMDMHLTLFVFSLFSSQSEAGM